jgi:rhomboid protease GluP
MFDSIVSEESAPLVVRAEGGRRATFSVLLVLAAVFALEVVVSGRGAATLAAVDEGTLVVLGAESRTLVVGRGEWYRCFAAALLHLNAVHLLANAIAISVAGWYLEPILGWKWLTVLLGAGTVGGSALSLAVNSEQTLSVGASSAILAVFAAGVMIGMDRLPESTARSKFIGRLTAVLLPALLPASRTAEIGYVDYAGHLGGILAGAVVGRWIVQQWPEGELGPRVGSVVGRVAAVVIGAFLLSVAFVAVRSPRYEALRHFVPEEKWPSEADADTARTLIQQYPADPRVHFVLGAFLLEAADWSGAERELRTALAQAEPLAPPLRPGMLLEIRRLLAVALAAQGRTAEAKEAAKPACGVVESTLPKEILQRIEKELCGAVAAR